MDLSLTSDFDSALLHCWDEEDDSPVASDHHHEQPVETGGERSTFSTLSTADSMAEVPAEKSTESSGLLSHGNNGPPSEFLPDAGLSEGQQHPRRMPGPVFMHLPPFGTDNGYTAYASSNITQLSTATAVHDLQANMQAALASSSRHGLSTGESNASNQNTESHESSPYPSLMKQQATSIVGHDQHAPSSSTTSEVAKSSQKNQDTTSDQAVTLGSGSLLPSPFHLSVTNNPISAVALSPAPLDSYSALSRNKSIITQRLSRMRRILLLQLRGPKLAHTPKILYVKAMRLNQPRN